MKTNSWLSHSLMVSCLFAGASGAAQTISETPPPELAERVAAAEAAVENGGSGPCPAVMTSDPTLPTHTVYRPADLEAASKDGALPIVAWANGGCATDGNRYRYFLTEIASHGYLVLAIGPVGPSSVEWKWPVHPERPEKPLPHDRTALAAIGDRPAPSLPSQLNVAIDWALTENERSDSIYFGRLDPERIGVMGTSCGGLQAIAAASDPRVKTLVAWNSGTWAEGSRAPGGGLATKAYLEHLHTPVAYISGDESDVAFENSIADYEAVDSVPVLHAWRLGSGHDGTYQEPGGGEYTGVALAWLDWQLRGSEDASRVFMGADCTLCTDENWGIKRKGWPLGADGAGAADRAARASQRTPSPNDTLVSTEIAPDRRVTFRIYAPKAGEVLVRGDLIEGYGTAPLIRDETGVWSATLGPLAPDYYTYSFVVDGVKTIDPKNTEIKPGLRGIDNLLMVAGPGAEYIEAKPVPHGEIRTAWYPSTTLGGERRLHVYTPPGYDGSADRYPVFYLVHGGGDDDAGWSTVGRAGFIMDNLLAAGKALPMVIVMPNASLPPPPDTPMPRFVPGTTASPEDLAAWTALLERFTSELMNDIVPFVEKSYRVRIDPGGRALAGLSMGGLQAQRVVIKHPDAFAYVGIWSAGVRLGVPTEAFETDAAAFLAAPDEANEAIRLLSIRVAEHDHALEGSRRLAELLTKHGIEHTLEENGGGHTWLNWRLYLNDLLPRLFR